jgi:hypothetical protein
LIASQIGKLTTNKIETMIALKWEKETTSASIDAADNHNPNVVPSKDESSKILILQSRLIIVKAI